VKEAWHSESKEEQEDDFDDKEFTPSQKSAAKLKTPAKQKSPVKGARQPKKSQDDWLVDTDDEEEFELPQKSTAKQKSPAR
jgi:hypothetical protein